jgi:hypothetical protein
LLLQTDAEMPERLLHTLVENFELGDPSSFPPTPGSASPTGLRSRGCPAPD